MIVRSEGKLTKLLVNDGQQVESGQILAFTESTANAEQVLDLENQLKHWNKIISHGQWNLAREASIGNFGALGEIQNDFQSFTLKLAELKSFLAGGFYLQKRSLLEKDVSDLKLIESNLMEQLELQKRDFKLAQEEFNTQEMLFQQKVIAPIEYKREKAKLLAKEFPLKNLAASLIQSASSQTAKQKEILELDNAISEQKNSFLQTLQSLQSSIASWKQRYMLIAPVSGLVSFSGPWTEQQFLTIGQELLTIEPIAGQLEGIVKIPQVNLGKIVEGQEVLIKLDGYPYREFGMVTGSLTKLSQTPGRDSLYWGYVALPSQLTTRYKRKLSYRNGMKGTAEIITADKRLAERLIATIRDGGK